MDRSFFQGLSRVGEGIRAKGHEFAGKRMLLIGRYKNTLRLLSLAEC